MKVVIDASRCTGHGRCYMSAPEIFDYDDDDGYGSVVNPDVEPGSPEAAAAEHAAANCPESAISLEQP